MYALDLNVDESATGLLKMDFLGLRNLSILGEALKFLKEQQNIEIDLNDISIKDSIQVIFRAYNWCISNESPGMRRVARTLNHQDFQT